MKRSTIDFMILFADTFEVVLDIAWKVALIALSVHIITLENFY